MRESNTARLDSGAEATFLRESTVSKLDLPVIDSTNDSVTVIFGNNSSSTSSATALINESLSAYILPDEDLIEDLISINPILDIGYNIQLFKDKGWVKKGDRNVLPITRSGPKWTLDLNQLQCLSCTTASDETRNKVQLLHERMGHSSMQCMIDAITKETWITNVTASDIKKFFQDDKCPTCILAKRNSLPIPKSITDPKTLQVGQLLSGDIVGPITPSTRNGDKYFYLFCDRRSGFLHAYTAASKAGFITALKDVCSFYAKHGHKVKGFRSDSEHIMIYGDVAIYLEENNIEQTMSLPNAHFQNLVERHVQTINNTLSTIIHGQDILNSTFWDYALYHAIQLRNICPNTKTEGRSPLSLVTGSGITDLTRSFLFKFGQPVAARIHKTDKEWKFDLKRDIGIYLGEAKGSVNGGLVYFPSNGRILPCHDLISLKINIENFQRLSYIRDNVKRIPSEKLDELQIGLPEEKNVKGDTAPAEQLDDLTVKTSNTSNKEPNFSGQSPSVTNIANAHEKIINKKKEGKINQKSIK